MFSRGTSKPLCCFCSGREKLRLATVVPQVGEADVLAVHLRGTIALRVFAILLLLELDRRERLQARWQPYRRDGGKGQHGIPLYHLGEQETQPACPEATSALRGRGRHRRGIP